MRLDTQYTRLRALAVRRPAQRAAQRRGRLAAGPMRGEASAVECSATKVRKGSLTAHGQGFHDVIGQAPTAARAESIEDEPYSGLGAAAPVPRASA